ncbi:peptidoglycan-binding domain-containing protein [Xylanimonas sp. McL0601]|uniref:peptidoglycan-binding domain-containing protein n=1 Tax=Xylanimonas sp. McL0601 TaxID=3414739 RepID=UPI003CF1D9DA
MALVSAAVLLGGCTSGNPESALDRAEAQVAEKEKALADAQAAATETTDAFCTSAAGYVTALDRYGDVLTAEGPTVGDVSTAGADLLEPRQDVLADGQAAQEARKTVADAENALAEANATLANLQASASGSTEPSSTPSPSVATPVPVAPAESVARVKQADADFTTAQQEITDDTPLDEASEKFNAAAVALEVSWLRLVADAGCVSDEQLVQGQKAVLAYTTALQQSLADAGYYAGKADGVYGPDTVAAVEALQEAHELPVTGVVDAATEEALRTDLAAKGEAAAQSAVATTAALQQTLHLLGYWDGPVDGKESDALTQALKKFQTDLGVPPTGVVDAATVAAFEAAIAQAKQPEPAPSATASPVPAPSGSATPAR